MQKNKLLFLLIITIACLSVNAFAEAVVNHALDASVTADSEFSDQYLAQFVANGVIPELGKQNGSGKEWAVQGDTHRNGAELTMKWEKPVQVAELVYYSRSAYGIEGWQGYEIYLDDQKKPAKKGTLKSGHGPQRIPLGKTVEAKNIRIKFTSSYGGSSPGAAEIQVYNISPPDKLIGEFQELPPFYANGRLPWRMFGDCFWGQPLPALPLGESKKMAQLLNEGELGFEKILLVKRHAFDLTHIYVYHVEAFIPGGGIYIFTPNDDGGELEEIFDAGDGEVMDIALSYDGTEILFSWKQTDVSPLQQKERNFWEGPSKDIKTKYQIYRMSVNPLGKKAAPKQLTHGNHNNFNPSWLPDGKIAFLSDRKESFAYCFVTTSPLLHRMDGDGSNQHRISHGYLNDFTPSVLNDGRIIYSRWEYVDRPAIPAQGLWTMNPDGTGVSGFFGNRCIEPGTFMEARSIGNTRNVLCVLTGHGGSCRGAIGVVSTAHGSNAQEGIRNVTPEVWMPSVEYSGGMGNAMHNVGPYENPFPIDENYFLVSRRGTIQLRDYEAKEKLTVLKSNDGMGFYSPVPLRATKLPRIIPSLLPENATRPWGSVVVQDVYNGLEPDIKRGEIKQICVVQEIEKGMWSPLLEHVPTSTQSGYGANSAFGFLFPAVSCGSTYAPKKIWGYAKVEKDGSAHFEVPTGVPVYFMAIDDKGRAVQRMRTFTHFQPGEKQNCTGCHADRNYSTPHTSGAQPIASLRPVQKLPEPEWGRENFDYSKVVQPVLDKHCIECHNSRKHPKEIDLSGDKTDFFNVSYDILARKGSWGEWQPEAHRTGVLVGKYKSYATVGKSPFANVPKENMKKMISPYTAWIPSMNGTEENILMIKPRTWGSPASLLADIILSGHPDEDGKPRVKMDKAGQRRLMAWMDLNVPYYSDSKSNYTDRMGCRRMLPPNLGKVLADVAKRRCGSCHNGGKIPRKFYTRVTNIEENDFLHAPLAEAAGGSEKCGKAIFKDKTDPDYQKILAEFVPITKMLKDKPSLDMPGAKIEACKTCE